MTDEQDTTRQDAQQAVEEEHRLIRERRAKLSSLREAGRAFPNDFRRDALAAELHEDHDAEPAELFEQREIRASVAGRMMLRRVMGKASFVTLQDMSGQIQLYVRRDNLPEGCYADFKQWDLGDILGGSGRVFKTRTGELSVEVDELRLLTKSLRPLPDKHKGLTDTELRYRQRYVDLIVNEESRRLFQLRSKVIAAIRGYLNNIGYLEVETPMMQPIPGGAAARPFITHHNTLDMQLYLRIAPELYLKRLVVGGFEKVFEINRNFRNEGLSTRHNPEFTMLEFYQAYATHTDLMDLTEHMMCQVASQVLGGTVIRIEDRDVDLAQPFRRLTVAEAVLEFNPALEGADLRNAEVLRAHAAHLQIPLQAGWGPGKLLLEIFEDTAESRLVEPTFVTAYPTEVSPLARRNDEDPEVTDRFELIVGGREIANGFAELNDAEDQAERFRDQVVEKEAGDEEAMYFDEDYITALEYGLPPTAGEGIGIDRLVMLLANVPSIRDVILFPLMRPRAE